MKSVIILSASDAWNRNHDTMGIFSTKRKAIKAIPAKLNEDDLFMLNNYNQTQGRDQNFELNEVTINQLN